MIKQPVNQTVVKKGVRIFYKIQPELEKKYEPGYYISIEVKSGKYFIGRSPTEALNKAKHEFPDKQFFLAQVGRIAGILK